VGGKRGGGKRERITDYVLNSRGGEKKKRDNLKGEENNIARSFGLERGEGWQ